MFILFAIMVTLNCFGRFMISAANTLELAIVANKCLYIGACFTPPLAVFILARLCEHKLPKFIKEFMIAYSSLVMGLVLTIGYSDVYYKHVELGHQNGFSYLIKSYGPGHVLYSIMMVMYAAIMVFYLVYGIKNRKQLSFITVTILCVSCFSIILMYIVERILGLKISLMSVGYLFGIALLFNYINRINIYDMSSNVVSAIEKMNEYGYIVFDDKYRYVNSNTYLREIFPEINGFCVDKGVQKSDTFFYNEIMKFLYEWDCSGSRKKTIALAREYFDVEIRIISYGRKEKVGYLIEFINRTIEHQYYNTIKEYNASLEEEVEQKTEHIWYIKDMMVLGMADMVESRDNSTGGHIKRTSAVVKIFAEVLKEYCDEFGFDYTFLKCVEKAAPMHDLGKIAIDDVILRKPGKYTEEEFDKMKKHSEEGAKIVVSIMKGVEDDYFVEIAENVAHYHHEKWNGKGYPQGLSGNDIPIEARIMALADVFDALVSKRCYKEAFSYDEAFKIIDESLGEHFDPKLGMIFIKCRPKLEDIYNNYK